jgi:SprT protein
MTEYDMKRECEAKVKQSVSIIEKNFNVKMITPKVSFQLRGTCAGKACHSNNTIKVNPILLKENYEEMINQTIPHEVAHLATRVIYRRRVKPHGHEWREVMYSLGLEPTRCHQYDVSNARVCRRKRKKYKVTCSCQTHLVTSTIINRMREGATYSCRSCGGNIS